MIMISISSLSFVFIIIYILFTILNLIAIIIIQLIKPIHSACSGIHLEHIGSTYVRLIATGK